MLHLNLTLSHTTLFRSQLAAKILSKATLSREQMRTGAFRRAHEALIHSGLPEKAQDGILELNLHNSRLDCVLKPNVRQVALIIENFAPIHLRAIHRCLGYKSYKAVWKAFQTLGEAGLLEFTVTKKARFMEDVQKSTPTPIDAIPQVELRAAFTDLTRALRETCDAVILLGEFADGRGKHGKPAEVLALTAAAPQLDFKELCNTLVVAAEHIEVAHGISVHQTVCNPTDFICFLNSRHGVWPSIFVKAAQGIVIHGNVKHDGRALFEAVQKTLTYPEGKVEELLHSGTLARNGDGPLYFTDLGVKRYVRLARPPVLHRLNRSISILAPP